MKKTFLIAIMMVFAAGMIFGACAQQGTQARLEALENDNKALRKEVTTLNDIEAINKLERAYGFLLEHLMVDQVADLWAKDGAMEWVGLGRYEGQDTIRTLWHTVKDGFAERDSVLHPGPRYHGYVTINPDGKTAAGRWYVAGTSHGMEMLCENRYVKEDGVWKFSLLQVGGFPSMGGGAPSGGPGGKAPDEAEKERGNQEHMGAYPFTKRISRTPRQEHQNYLRPFSFKHPVTGEDLNVYVEDWNKSHPVPMPPGGEKWTEGQ